MLQLLVVYVKEYIINDIINYCPNKIGKIINIANLTYIIENLERTMIVRIIE
jgi:hypothetical protein